MKRRIPFLLAILSLFTLTSCGFLEDIREQIGGNEPLPTGPAPTVVPDNDNIPEASVTMPDNPGLYTVTYDFNNGSIAKSKVNNQNLAIKPEDPKKIAARFEYWCSDEELTKPFDFTTPLRRDTILYAKYDIDYAELTNLLSTDEIKGTIRIVSKFKKGVLVQQSLGSGTIIKKEGNYYYALTNNHVIYQPEGTSLVSYTVYDVYLNEYTASVLNASSTYDLALIRFAPKGEVKLPEPLPVIELAKDSLSKGEGIISVGNPLGQSNVITYGRVESTHAKFVPNASTIKESNVQFEVINHSAFINSGSSGGALFDTNLHLIGVNFASSTSIDDGSFMYSHAIPLNRVLEFLEASGFTI